LRRVQDHILLLIKSAQERVAAFLLEMAERASGSNIVELPMSSIRSAAKLLIRDEARRGNAVRSAFTISMLFEP
jgi:hypothetical protein